MTPDERTELLRDASSLAYQAIRFTGLYKELSSAEWEGLADTLAKRMIERLEDQIEAYRAALEYTKESSNAH